MSKEGKNCPFNDEMKCNDECGLYCIGMKCCVFHGINANLSKEIKKQDG